MKILFLTDLHGNFKTIEEVYKKEKPDLIIQVGDFGVWPGNEHTVKSKAKCPIYFVRGNHENHDILDTFPKHKLSSLYDSMRVIDNRQDGLSKEYKEFLAGYPFPKSTIHLADSGLVQEIDDKKFLFIGGASSIDKDSRVRYDNAFCTRTWWPQEVLTEEYKEYILNLEEHIDVIVSHTCPTSVHLQHACSADNLAGEVMNQFLEKCLLKFKPETWIYGHYHDRKLTELNNCKFICLGLFPSHLRSIMQNVLRERKIYKEDNLVHQNMYIIMENGKLCQSI